MNSIENKTYFDDNYLSYFNITIRGGTDSERSKAAVFSENRTVPILENPSDYIVGLVRFNIPAQYIPIFKWATQYPESLEDPALTVYMNYNGIVYSKNLEYIPKSNEVGNYIRLIWNFTDFILIINNAITYVFNEIRLVAGFPATMNCPQLVLDSTTNLISIFCDITMYTGSGIDLMMSKVLYSYFPSFVARQDVYIVPNKEVYKIYIYDNIINNITYKGNLGYRILQEFSTLSLWSGVQKILFISSTIPIDTELDGGQTNIMSRVIFDFIIDTSQINDRSTIIYTNTGGQRYYDLLSSFPMKHTDIVVEYQFNDNTSLPIKLLRDDVLTIKLQFVKKNLMAKVN